MVLAASIGGWVNSGRRPGLIRSSWHNTCVGVASSTAAITPFRLPDSRGVARASGSPRLGTAALSRSTAQRLRNPGTPGTWVLGGFGTGMLEAWTRKCPRSLHRRTERWSCCPIVRHQRHTSTNSSTRRNSPTNPSIPAPYPLPLTNTPAHSPRVTHPETHSRAAHN